MESILEIQMKWIAPIIYKKYGFREWVYATNSQQV